MKYIIITIITIFSLAAVGGSSNVFAATGPFDPLQQSCSGPQKDSAVCQDAQENSDTNPVVGNDGVLTKVTNLVAIVASVIAVIIIMVAGITMTLSSGESAKVQSSRDAIIYAVVGLVIIALARSIIIFIINRLG